MQKANSVVILSGACLNTNLNAVHFKQQSPEMSASDTLKQAQKLEMQI